MRYHRIKEVKQHYRKEDIMTVKKLEAEKARLMECVDLYKRAIKKVEGKIKEAKKGLTSK